MPEIRVGIIGVGNIAAMLVQSVEYYKRRNDRVGLIHTKIGNYDITDLKFVYAVDISKNKVGKDLANAIFAYPNQVPKIVDLPKLGVKVSMGKVLDGVAPHMIKDFQPANLKEPDVDGVAREISDAGVDVLINLLPVGSEEASRFYAKASARAGTAFVNAIPVFLASDSEKKYDIEFRKGKAPLLGDDIKGQLGATIVHRALASLIRMRGAELIESYQLNVGGNTDFKNMLLIERLSSKKVSKTMAVASTQPNPEDLINKGKVHAGPSGYVAFLGNIKIAYMYMRVKAFAGSEVEIDLKLKVDDKAMAVPVVVDAVRLAKVLKDHEISGSADWASAFYFKHPPKMPKTDYEALKMLYKGLEDLGEKIEPKLIDFY